MSLRLVRRVAKYWNPLLVRAPGLEYDPPRSRNAISHSYLHLGQMESVYVLATGRNRCTQQIHWYTDTMKSRAARVEEQNAFALLSIRHPRNGSLFD